LKQVLKPQGWTTARSAVAVIMSTDFTNALRKNICIDSYCRNGVQVIQKSGRTSFRRVPAQFKDWRLPNSSFFRRWRSLLARIHNNKAKIL